MIEDTEQRYDWLCRRCGKTWSWVYEVRTVTWGDEEIVLWRRGGADASPPHAGCRCPYCGGYRTVAHARPEHAAPADAV